ncbi:MAG TPA: class I SAM-dependent methyltransferase [Acidimicrobiales bacterium]
MSDVGMQSIPKQIVEIIRCPRCGEPVDEANGTGVRCPNDHSFDMDRGYLDASGDVVADTSTARTFASFGYEWNSFDEVRDEDLQFAEIYFRDLDLDSLEGKVGLDAGCGKGRFTRLLAAHLGAEVALDGSSAVDAAARNLGDLANVVVVNSDLRTAPFAPESFDFISSLGVLHHLADPRAGFTRLVELLAPGGQMLLYLYSRPSTVGARSVALALAARVRTLTVRLPHRGLRALPTPIAGALYAGVVAPGRWGQRHDVAPLAGLPMDTYRDKPFRSLVLDTFDRLSAPVEFRYVWADLEPWFADAGLVVDAARDETGWFIVAHRPES